MPRENEPYIVEDDPQAYAVTRHTAVFARKLWSQPLWRGIVALVAGICLLIWPSTALTWVLWGVLGLIIIDAIITLIAATTSASETGGRVGVSLLAIAGVIAAAAAVIWSETTSELLRYGLVVVVIVGGLISLIGSLRDRHADVHTTWELRCSAGLMSVLFGIIILIHRNDPDPYYAVLIATFFIMFSVVQILTWLSAAMRRSDEKRTLKLEARQAKAAAKASGKSNA